MDRWFSKNLPGNFVVNVILAFILIGSLGYAYAWKRLAYDKLAVPNQGYELRIEPGTSLRQFYNQLSSSGLFSSPRLLSWYVIFMGNDYNIKAGEYKIDPGITASQLIQKVISGEVAQYSFTIIEGWQTAQLLTELSQHPKIKITLAGLSTAEIIAKLNLPVTNLEGVFLPDTYFFVADTTDAEFLKRAYNSLDQKLQTAWQQRDTSTVLKTPYEALILASIIEKETGLHSEYAEISGVYNRRLQKHMKLQADPTVIYALQEQLNGPLLRKHLKTNSPYNTYKNFGLPPTPIALPSAAAIEAALHPAAGDALFFVATGDGGHAFSKDLVDHNKAVRSARRAASLENTKP